MTEAKVPRPRAELEAELGAQLGFLETSSRLFDEGAVHEAKRLATTIRVLAHDAKHSKSLLGQLGLKTMAFCDTANPVNPRNLLTHFGLVSMHVGAKGDDYVAMLDGSPRGEGMSVPFDAWWTSPVVVDTQRRHLSRRDIVLAVANQDGGSHVDSALDPAYHGLSRDNSLGWQLTGPDGSRPMGDPTPATIRQIAHELIKSIRARRTYSPPKRASAAPNITPSRNSSCPCGSGRKYKKCHGKGAV